MFDLLTLLGVAREAEVLEYILVLVVLERTREYFTTRHFQQDSDFVQQTVDSHTPLN